MELGTLSCNSLANAANAAAVGMTIHGERIVADQTSYTLVDGGIFDDGISRHVRFTYYFGRFALTFWK